MKGDIRGSLKTVLPLLFLFCLACGSEEPKGPTVPMGADISLRIEDSSVVEQGANELIFTVRASRTPESNIAFQYSLIGITAEANVDFNLGNGQGTISLGETSSEIRIQVIDDDIRELEEKIIITITSATGATITRNEAIGTIIDTDSESNTNELGYFTNESHYGYNLTWSDEYSGSELDPNFYNYEVGDGCPDVCGWGNSELQLYTSELENIKVEEGMMVITASTLGTGVYRSARVTTQGKMKFTHGRIDVRARLPFGQGIWPAI